MDFLFHLYYIYLNNNDMIKNKITNISGVKLDFFIKNEGSDDLFISLEPGQVAFSNGVDYTKSMRIFERKRLISITEENYDSLTLEINNHTTKAVWSKNLTEDLSKFHNLNAFDEMKKIIESENENKDEVLDSLHTTEDIEYVLNPYGNLLVAEFFTDDLDVLSEAKRQAEAYAGESSSEESSVEDSVIKEKKKYNYKKKPGRKKKRGPKPGSKRNKKE